MVDTDRVPYKPGLLLDEADTPPIEPKSEGRELNFMDDIEYHRACDYLDVSYDDRKDPKNAQKLAYLIDWAREKTKSNNRIDLIEAIQQLKRALGLQDVGLTAINKLYTWTRLEQRRLLIEKEQSLIAKS